MCKKSVFVFLLTCLLFIRNFLPPHRAPREEDGDNLNIRPAIPQHLALAVSFRKLILLAQLKSLSDFLLANPFLRDNHNHFLMGCVFLWALQNL